LRRSNAGSRLYLPQSTAQQSAVYWCYRVAAHCIDKDSIDANEMLILTPGNIKSKRQGTRSKEYGYFIMALFNRAAVTHALPQVA